jgi:NAD(P)-dependent dehydrogenase (short-subunit alcohol dehydrogenase family)
LLHFVYLYPFNIEKLSFLSHLQPEMSLQGKVIAISGGSSGIGLETARECLTQGAKISICSRNPNNLAKGFADLTATYPKESILSTAVDVSDGNAVASWIEKTVAHFGRLDGAVNNAGVRCPICSRLMLRF